MEKMRAQSLKHGTTIFTETIERVDLSVRPFKVFKEDSDEPILAESLIISTGATAKYLYIYTLNYLISVLHLTTILDECT